MRVAAILAALPLALGRDHPFDVAQSLQAMAKDVLTYYLARDADAAEYWAQLTARDDVDQDLKDLSSELETFADMENWHPTIDYGKVDQCQQKMFRPCEIEYEAVKKADQDKGDFRIRKRKGDSCMQGLPDKCGNKFAPLICVPKAGDEYGMMQAPYQQLCPNHVPGPDSEPLNTIALTNVHEKTT